jgi:ATP-binding cassette subfamily B protein
LYQISYIACGPVFGVNYTERNQQKYELRWKFFLNVLTSLVASGAFVIVAAEAFAGHLSLGDVTLYVNAVTSVQGGLGGIISSISGLNENALFYTYFTNLLALPQPLSLSESPHLVEKLGSGIELRHVSFRYSEEHPWVLRDVNLYIPAGQCLALVGLNGAGKTTLVKLLLRFYDPSEGQILWDGTNIREFEPAALRRRIGAVFQDFMRYDLTAQENIGLGDIKHVEDIRRVREAAAKASIHDKIEQLPQGYQTTISLMFGGEGPSVDLSTGEWQKIATARMFMRESDLLILDEPTAALDAQAEHDTYNHFVELLAGRTSVLISHRFSTVRMADVIAVLENGKITEYGSHEQLLALAGTYAKLYTMQAEKYN